MALQEELKTQGDFLFRYRSYLPLSVLPLFILVIFTSETFLLSAPQSYNTPLILAALLVGLLGQGVRIWVAGFVPRDTSGRNTKEQKANVLNSTGLYSLCRNPLYLGNFLMMLSPTILLGNWLFIMIFALSFWLYYERIIFAEESFLRVKFGQAYIDWTLKTPPFFPKLKGYVKSDMSFSFRSMIKREYHSLFGLAASLFVLHYVVALLVSWQNHWTLPCPNTILTVFFLLCAVFYLMILILVKKTRIFNVDGR